MIICYLYSLGNLPFCRFSIIARQNIQESEPFQTLYIVTVSSMRKDLFTGTPFLKGEKRKKLLHPQGQRRSLCCVEPARLGFSHFDREGCDRFIHRFPKGEEGTEIDSSVLITLLRVTDYHCSRSLDAVLTFSDYARILFLCLAEHPRQRHEFPCEKSHLACHHTTLSAEAGRNPTRISSAPSPHIFPSVLAQLCPAATFACLSKFKCFLDAAESLTRAARMRAPFVLNVP